MPYTFCTDCVEECGDHISTCSRCHAVLCQPCVSKHRESKQKCDKQIQKDKKWKEEMNWTKKCGQHRKEKISFDCQTCDEVICKTCSKDKHSGHDIKPLQYSAESKVEEYLRRINLLSEAQILQLVTLLLQIKEDIGYYNKAMDNLQTEAKLLSDSNLITQEVVGKLQRQRDYDVETLKIQLKSIHERVIEVEKFTDKSKQNAESLDALDFIIFFKRKERTLQVLTQKYSYDKITMPKDLLSYIDRASIKQMNQRLNLNVDDQPCSVDSKVFGINVEKMRSLLTKTENIDSVCPYVGSTAWIAGVEDTKISLIQEGDPEGTLSFGTGFKVHEIAFSEEDGLVVIPSDDQEADIYRMTENDEMDVLWRAASSFTATCVSIAKNGDLLVGLGSEREGCKVVRLSRKKLCTSDQSRANNGVIQEISVKTDNSKLYKYPYRVTENANEDVLVIDHYKRAVVGVNKDGEFLFEYDGSRAPEKYKEYQFDPRGITTDQNSNILIADYINDCIHLVDPKGNFVQILLSKEYGISYPRCLALSGNGKLWIGQRNGKIHIFSYCI